MSSVQASVAAPARELRYDATVSRTLVHRAAVAEVFLTDAEALGGDRFLLAAQLPRTHAFFNDTEHGGYDVLLCMEAARQAGVLLAHRHYGVPTDFAFVLDRVDFRVTAPEALRVGRAPGRLLFDMTLSDQTYRRGTLATLRFSAVATVDGEASAEGSGSLLFLPRSTYRRLRAQARLNRPIGDTATPASSPLAPAAVGRRDQRNVVLAGIRPGQTGETLIADVVVDQRHATLFDHPLDHVPGMLLMEACRQAAIVSASQVTGRAPQATITGCAVAFERFAELDEPTVCRATAGTPVERADGRVAVPVHTRLEQRDTTVASATVEVTL